MAGLGYYADNGYTVELNLAKTLFQIGEAPPVPLRLDKLVPCGHKPDREQKQRDGLHEAQGKQAKDEAAGQAGQVP
jgi:hypothetical protein